jgi:hypothetical protein
VIFVWISVNGARDAGYGVGNGGFGCFRRGRDFHDRLSKLVAAGDGHDGLVAGLRAGEGFAQQVEMLAEVALLDAGIGPEGFKQLALGDDALWVQDEVGEQVEGFGADGDGARAAMKRAMGEVDLEVLEPVFALFLERHSCYSELADCIRRAITRNTLR